MDDAVRQFRETRAHAQDFLAANPRCFGVSVGGIHMDQNGTITLPRDVTAVEAANTAAESGCGLFITRDGEAKCAPQPQPGWQRVGVFIKEAGK